MVDKAIQSEVAYLKDTGLGFTDLESTTVALRVLTQQSMVCYVSSGEAPVIPLLRHIAGYVMGFSEANNLEHLGLPYPDQPNIGSWLIVLDLAVRRLEECVQNSARGEAVEHLSTIMSILKGCMGQHGVDQRQGFEIE